MTASLRTALKIAIAAAALLLAGATAAEPAPRVILHTSKGPITIELYPDTAPLSVANFLEYARSGFYDGTVFHRVVTRFMIQGGGYTADLMPKETRDPIPNEAGNGLLNAPWTVAMARSEDADSATSEFYINLRLNDELDRRPGKAGYAVFGAVVEGQYVANDISLGATRPAGDENSLPLAPVVIERVEILP
jgi:cyclophilin family peptidyl-prolyl cis-trans isomerase